jgi:hypothetical protein
MLFSAIWGTALLLGAIGAGIVAGGAASRPIEKMVEAEAAAG